MVKIVPGLDLDPPCLHVHEPPPDPPATPDIPLTAYHHTTTSPPPTTLSRPQPGSKSRSRAPTPAHAPCHQSLGAHRPPSSVLHLRFQSGSSSSSSPSSAFSILGYLCPSSFPAIFGLDNIVVRLVTQPLPLCCASLSWFSLPSLTLNSAAESLNSLR